MIGRGLTGKHGTAEGAAALGLDGPLAEPPTGESLAELAEKLEIAAEGIAAREAQFALLARATGDAVWDWHLDTDMIACSHGGSAVLGLKTDAFVRPFSWWQEQVHPDDRRIIEDSVADIRAGNGDLWSVEYRVKHADGAYRCVWDRGIVVRDQTQRAVRIVGCMTDISARRSAEEMLQHVERRQHALITAVSSIVWRDELGAAVQPRNPGWEEYTGQTPGEEFGRGWLDAVHPEDREATLAAWSNAIENGSVYHADLRLRRRDGVYRWMSARGAPVRDKDGNIVEWIGLYEDVDDHYAALEELRSKSFDLAERVKELRCLHAVTVACNNEEMRVADILRGVALVLPSALMHPEAGACSIECAGAVFRSPAFLPAVTEICAPLVVDHLEIGYIRLGYTRAAGHLAFIPEEKHLLRTVANLVGSMLARRKDRRRLEHQSQELWRRQAMFQQTERLAKVGGWEYDVKTGAITWSDEVYRIAGIDPGEAALDRQAVDAEFLHGAINEALRTGKPFDVELPWALPSGATKWLHTVGQVQIVNDEPTRIFGIVKDVTEEREARRRIWNLANRDALTGLPNRRYFAERLEAALAKGGNVQALLMLDLDHFKDVNDTLGHDVGDALLSAVAERLSEAAAESSTVARLGGDEFAVLLQACDREQARQAAEALFASLKRPIVLARQHAEIRVSAGLAISPRDGGSATELMKNADIALYLGKMRGRNALVPYAPEMRISMERRVAVRSEVRVGLDRNEFVPFYQPKICLKTGMVTGFEALLRWNHPAGLRGPASIKAAFDDHELALALGKCMLDCIIVDMVSWRGDGVPFGHVALNTSAAEFTGVDLAEHVLTRLAEANLPAESLGIEVTETVLLGREAEAVGPTLRRLKEAGVGIALDDFGTGYASLTHLQQYPVDIIKIDQSFIRSLETDPGSQAITSAVLGLGRSLGMTVIAEGVETEEQMTLLRVAGCDQVQGYLFARPMAAAEVSPFLAGWSGLPEMEQESARSAA